MSQPQRRKKRVRPARKIIPRGQMGIQWIIASVALAGIILILGVIFLLTH